LLDSEPDFEEVFLGITNVKSIDIWLEYLNKVRDSVLEVSELKESLRKRQGPLE